MSDEKLKRKGSLSKDQEGSLVLVNDNKQGYKVDQVVAAIWYATDGKTEDELASDLAAETQADKGTIKKDVSTIVTKLKEVNLVE